MKKKDASPATGAPVQIVRVESGSAQPGAQVSKGQPSLIVTTVAHYDWIYNDQGTHADMDVTIWRPHPGDGSFFIIGDYAQGNYGSPVGTAYAVKAINDDPASPLIKGPVDYQQVWADHKSGGTYDGSIWFPVPPDGYVTIGFIGQSGYNKPALANFACLRRDLVKQTDVGPLIWNDKGSGASDDVSLYRIVNVPNAFVAQGSYQPYSGNAYQLTQSV